MRGGNIVGEAARLDEATRQTQYSARGICDHCHQAAELQAAVCSRCSRVIAWLCPGDLPTFDRQPCESCKPKVNLLPERCAICGERHD